VDVKENKNKSLGPFAGPIRSLRKALGLSMEAAAHRIDMTLGAWRTWESGLKQPRRAQLEAIANLTDSPGLRMKFWLDVYGEGIKLGVASEKPMTPREIVMLRYINDSIGSLRELCVAAAEGSTASEQTLRRVADDLMRAAADAEAVRGSRILKHEEI
jgi:transcriptional regulator with XRE-family HTH domain